MKQHIRRLIELLPGDTSYAVLDWMRRCWYPQVRLDYRRQRAILQKIGHPDRVLQGPFAGMKYASYAYYGGLLAKILGTYEKELTVALDAVTEFNPDLFVDIGAAEGYYAVGLARRYPQARMICFEMNNSAHRLIRGMANRNGVAERIDIRGICTTSALNDAVGAAKRAAVVCDCEGAENILMDPVAVPALSNALLIIETHEWAAPGLCQRLRERFQDTHELRAIDSRPRTLSDLPDGIKLDEADARFAMYEGRPDALWYLFTPRS